MRDTPARRRSPTSRGSVTAACLAAAMALLPTGAQSTEPPDAAASGGGPPATMVVLEEQWKTSGMDLGQPPMVIDGAVVGTSDGVVHAVDSRSGRLIWELESDRNGPLPFSPTADRGIVLLLRQPEGSPTATLVALELDTPPRVERWSRTFDLDTGLPYGHPRLTDDGTVVVSLYRAADAKRPEGEQGEAHGFAVLDARDGSELWHLFPTDCWSVGPGLVVAPMDTYLGGEATPRGITGRDATTGVERWFLAGQQANDCPIVGGDSVFISRFEENGILAVDADTGVPRWRIDMPRVRELTADGDRLYVEQGLFLPDDGPDQVRIVALDPSDGTELWASEPFQDEVEQTVAADGRVYVAMQDNADVMQGGLLVLDARLGHEIGFVDLGLLGVAVTPDTVYTVSSDFDAHDQGVLRAYRTREVPIVADLPRMTLTPGDLADAGLTGFGLGSGATTLADDVIASTAAARGLPEADVRAVLEGAGTTRRYANDLVRPEDPSDPDGPVGIMVSSYVTEFRDAAGAAAAWELLEDESGSTTARDLEALRDLGDGSEVTADSGEDESGAPYRLLDLTIRRGNLHLGITVVDWTGGEPRVEDLGPLAERLLERVARVIAHPVAGLGGRALRVSGTAVAPILDRYTIEDGVTLPLQGEPAPEPRERSLADVLTEPSDAYEVQVHVQRPDGDSWILVGLDRYLTTGAATDGLASWRESIEGGSMKDVAVDDMPGLGPGAFAYTATGGSSGLRYHGLRFQVGTTVAAIQFLAGTPVDAAEAVEALAEAQRTCLTEGCVDPVPVPAALTR